MRTTVRLKPSTVQALKRYAHSQNQSMTAVIEEALVDKLLQKPRKLGARKLELPTFGKKGPVPSIDLHSNSTLREIMDADHAARRQRSR